MYVAHEAFGSVDCVQRKNKCRSDKILFIRRLCCVTYAHFTSHRGEAKRDDDNVDVKETGAKSSRISILSSRKVLHSYVKCIHILANFVCCNATISRLATIASEKSPRLVRLYIAYLRHRTSTELTAARETHIIINCSDVLF